MAETSAFVEPPALSLESEVDIPAGEPTEEERMNSSKFIGSDAATLAWVTDFFSRTPLPPVVGVSRFDDLNIESFYQSFHPFFVP
jgi:hypothetical protein